MDNHNHTNRSDASHTTSASRTISTHSPKKPKGKFRLFIIFLGVVILAILLLLIGSISIRQYISTLEPCGQDVVASYNHAIKSTESFASELSTLAAQVEAKPNYNKSITCVFIVYRHYAYVQDVDKTRQLFEQFKKLQSHGKKVDSNIIDPETLEQMEEYTKSLEHNRNTGDRSDGTG